MKNQVKEVVKKTIKKMVDSEVDEWPPKCLAIYYQPVRPSKKMMDEQHEAGKKNGK